MVIYEEWDGKKRRWAYDGAYCLELEAQILVNRLECLIAQCQRVSGQRHTSADDVNMSIS